MSYRNRAATAANDDPPRYACAFCHQPSSEYQHLAMYGARCLPCYRSYCHGSQYPGKSDDEPMTVAEKRALAEHLKAMMQLVGRAPSKDWALKLKQREANGETLSRVQRDAWRRALREPVGAA